MLSKIENIKNFAVFKDFSWDKNVQDNAGNVLEFKKHNIIYGRNYSGKTSLSRIVRAVEKGELPLHYDGSSFVLQWDDGSNTTDLTLNVDTHCVRVFNEDFIRENLAFITSVDAGINSFAVIGEDNVTIAKEIDEILDELGEKDVEKGRSKMYAILDSLKQDESNAKSSYQQAENQLNQLLSNKASGDRQHSIKYNPSFYGDQNYTVSKLKAEIDIVRNSNYKPLLKAEIDEKKRLISSAAKNNIATEREVIVNIQYIENQVRQLVERKVGKTEKIEELVRDTLLNHWVREGVDLHLEKRKKCAFCGQEITEDRWHQLKHHFDEESRQLEQDLGNQIQYIDSIKAKIAQGYCLTVDMVYVHLENLVMKYNEEYAKVSSCVLNQLDALENQLKQRKDESLFEPIAYVDSFVDVEQLHSLYVQYIKLCNESNDYTNNLHVAQDEARKRLRYQAIYDFVKEIGYDDQLKSIAKLRTSYEKSKEKRELFEKKIAEKETNVIALQLKLNDEEKGAVRVNDYLNNYFGHNYLSLHAVKNEETDAHYRFEVIRNGVKAYNLSEGECSIVAFCYFMAKLHDSTTEGSNPIVWIDDPISSLDGNHIFFVYSLINSELVQRDDYEQLFISTHNLDFFKYLKRLPDATEDLKKKEAKRKYRFLLLNRVNEQSSLNLMPRFMIDYVTEFNFLFKQIYDCAQVSCVTDKNYQLFYNFGNNARKFLELFLYYKYPDNTKDIDKYVKFFDGNKLPATLVMRVNNEYSHLLGVFERGEALVEVPEMKKIADLIIKTIKMKDEEQYNALLRSIGVDVSLI